MQAVGRPSGGEVDAPGSLRNTPRVTIEEEDMSRSSEALAQLIEERLRPGAHADEIDDRINRLFGEEWCIVFTDMAGFSRRAARSGIIPFLVLIHQMDKICLPVIQRNAGFLLKKIADSHMILFRHPKEALKACVEMQQAIFRYNETAPDSDHIYLGCGIGWGHVLKLGDEDVYGVEVNFAAKLGEDLAGPYDVFLTPDAMKACGTSALAKFKKVPGGRLGGTKLPYFAAVYERGAQVEHKKRAQRTRLKFK